MRTSRRRAGDRIVRPRAWLLTLVTAVLAMAGCTSGADGADSGRSVEQELQGVPDLTDCPAPTGQPATGEQSLPELSLPCLDAGGGDLALGEAPGVPLVLNLWASWCRPCIAELPLFEDLYSAVDPSQLQVIGVNSRDSASFAADLVEELDLTFANGFDDNGDVMVAALVRNLPGTVFIDAGGAVAFVKRDKVIETYTELVALVQQHLGVVV
ncbi:MAG: TlpA family protein disulfide reductase [Geodermatophilaceae bacterium]